MVTIIKSIYRRLRLFFRIFIIKKYRPVDLWFWKKGDQTFRINYSLDENSIVFDLGGYKGEWAKSIYERYKPTIFIFEPVSAFYLIIEKKFEKIDSIKTFQFGLGGVTRSEEIFLNDNGSSTHRPGGQCREKISIISIKEFFTEHSIEFVDLMKINIEGEEYPLLETIIKADLQYKIDNIQIQFHPWVNGAETKREEIRQALSASHRLTYDFPFVWENWERIQ